VELHRAIGLFGSLHHGTKAMHSCQNHGCDGSPSMLPRHTGRIDIVDTRAWSPLVVSGALHGLDGKEAEVPSTLHTILGVCFEWPLQFSPTIQIARCRTAHLALLIFSELGQKLPFLAIDLEAHPALLPVIASGGYHGRHPCSGNPHRDCRQLPSRGSRTDTSSS
jgi:hypothetical protein